MELALDEKWYGILVNTKDVLYNNREVYLKHKQHVGAYHLDTLVLRQMIVISFNVPCFLN